MNATETRHPLDQAQPSTDQPASAKTMAQIIGRFAVIFPIPAGLNQDALPAVWAELLSDVPECDMYIALHKLSRSLTRFPVPADVLRVVGEKP